MRANQGSQKGTLNNGPSEAVRAKGRGASLSSFSLLLAMGKELEGKEWAWAGYES